MIPYSLHTDSVQNIIDWYNRNKSKNIKGLKVSGVYYYKPDPNKSSIAKNLNGELYAVDLTTNELLIGNNPFPALANGLRLNENIYTFKEPIGEGNQYIWVRFSHVHGVELVYDEA